MDIVTILAILRTIMYLWIAIEFTNLTYLYWVGYTHSKKTPIIKALQIMFFFLSIRSLVYAFLPILIALSPEWFTIVTSLLPLILIPIGLAVRKFRTESLNKQIMRLPGKKEDIKNE
jgi:hypothetical protein